MKKLFSLFAVFVFFFGFIFSNSFAQFTSIADCPDTGVGGDPRLNHVKNRTDAPIQGSVQAKTLADIAAIHQPSSWSSGDDRSALQTLGEGLPVEIEGYLINVKHYPSGTEACNCGLKKESNNDFHLVIGLKKNSSEAKSITGEMTPRVRLANHPNWTYKKLQAIVGSKSKIRATGWLMLDTQHISRPLSRATNWELHPITSFEVQQPGGTWKKFDDM